jgi:hypothetical protein
MGLHNGNSDHWYFALNLYIYIKFCISHPSCYAVVFLVAANYFSNCEELLILAEIDASTLMQKFSSPSPWGYPREIHFQHLKNTSKIYIQTRVATFCTNTFFKNCRSQFTGILQTFIHKHAIEYIYTCSASLQICCFAWRLKVWYLAVPWSLLWWGSACFPLQWIFFHLRQKEKEKESLVLNRMEE